MTMNISLSESSACVYDKIFGKWVNKYKLNYITTLLHNYVSYSLNL